MHSNDNRWRRMDLHRVLGMVLMAGLAWAGAGVAWAGTAHTVSVTATGGALSAGEVGDDLTASVSADVADPPDVTDETTISGPVWTWSVVDAQWFNPATQEDEDSGYYTVFFDNDGDSSQPGATIHVTLLRSGTWDITVQAAVHYSQPCADGSFDTWDGSGLADVTGSALLNAVIQVERAGAGPFAKSADVAGGGISTSEHMADVKVLVTNTGGTAVKGAYVDAPLISGGDGEDTDASFPFPAGAATDDTGKYEADASFTSSDLTPQDVSLSTRISTATIHQRWNELPDPWIYDPSFDYDTPDSITFTMAFDGNVGITGHTITFINTAISGDYWDPNAGELDPDTGQPEGDYVSASFAQADIQALASLSSPPAIPGPDDTPTPTQALQGMLACVIYGATTAKSNVYQADQTIDSSLNFGIDSVDFDAVDDTVYGTAPTS